MVSDYSFKSTLDIPREVLWRAITSDNRAFMNHLVNDGALNRMDSTKIEDLTTPNGTTNPNNNNNSAGKKGRKQTYVPKTIEIPAMVKSVFDDTYLEIFDSQSWNENKPYELDFEISTGVLGDYYTMHGHTRLEVNPDDKDGLSCIQTIHGTCKVEIPFVGWYVEQAILLNMGQFYDAYPGHIANFVQELIGSYEGTKQTDGLLEALERLEKYTDTLPAPTSTNTKESETPAREQQDKAALAAALGQVPANVPGRNSAGIKSSSAAAAPPSEGATSKPSSAPTSNVNKNNEGIAAPTNGEIANGLHTNN